jgi:ubiquinol-cytochrome c reductase cytochrome c subunit
VQAGVRRAALLVALAALLPAAARADPPQQGIVHVPGSPKDLGRQLYAGNCIMCHGPNGIGTHDGPPLRGVGARAADFYLRTGYMPLHSPDTQPRRTRVLFSEREIRAIVSYVASLGGPKVPAPHPERGSLGEGLHAFTEHCAGCHQVAAVGGVVTGAVAPDLHSATAVQIAEAVRIGPYVMPSFSPRQISNRELDSIIRYVQYTRTPDDRGGWGLGHLGPAPEGLVAWLIAGAALVAVCVLIGQRLKK